MRTSGKYQKSMIPAFAKELASAIGSYVDDRDRPRKLQINRPLLVSALYHCGKSCGGDDFAHYGSMMPMMMAFVGLAGAPVFSSHPLHHPAFLPPYEAIDAVARAQAQCFVAAATAALIRAT